MAKDSLYSQPQKNIGDFVFDQKVADCFEDMIQRSVPGYRSIIHMIGILAQQYAVENSRCYDLGCSLGAGILSMRQRLDKNNITIIGVDNSEAMLEKCRNNIEQGNKSVDVQLQCKDIREVDIQNASVVVCNFTLQFVAPQERQTLVNKIYAGMNSGGVFVLSEKIVLEDPRQEEFQTQLYHAFKKLNGYSDLEIAQKRTALENVLISETLEVHGSRLKEAGFSQTNAWFQCFNFVSMVAVK